MILRYHTVKILSFIQGATCAVIALRSPRFRFHGCCLNLEEWCFLFSVIYFLAHFLSIFRRKWVSYLGTFVTSGSDIVVRMRFRIRICYNICEPLFLFFPCWFFLLDFVREMGIL